MELLVQPGPRALMLRAPTTNTSQALFMHTQWRAIERRATLDAAAPRAREPRSPDDAWAGRWLCAPVFSGYTPGVGFCGGTADFSLLDMKKTSATQRRIQAPPAT